MTDRQAALAHKTPIALIGLSGTGKSTVGSLLAKALELEYRDVDREVERVSARSISSYFNGLRGSQEVVFRRLEAKVLASVLHEGGCVIATGGGIVETEKARRLLLGEVICVWLDAPASVLAERLADDHVPRPLLEGDLMSGLEGQRARRERWYRDLASIHLDTSKSGPEEVCNQVLDCLEGRSW